MCGAEDVLQRLVVIKAAKGVAVEKLAPGEQLAVDRAEIRFVADFLPEFGDGRDLMLDKRGV